MTTPYHKANAYAAQQKNAPRDAAISSRDTDSRALLACARRLDEAKRAVEGGSKDMLAYGEAIRYNQRIWSYFQVALCDPENRLPQDLKLTLLGLGRYVDKTSFEVVAKFDAVQIDSLININRLIATGLSREPPADALPPPADTREIPVSLMTSA